YPDVGRTLRALAQQIALADGQVIDRITVSLFPGGVIAGRVFDTRSDPAEYASVQALRVSRTGRGRPEMRQGSSTNDLGEFRLAHLEPGKYLLFVTPRREPFADMWGTGENRSAQLEPAQTY